MDGYMVRVILDWEIGGEPVSTYYAVLAESPEQAASLVSEKVPSARGVKALLGKMSPDTIERLKLREREAHHI